MLAQDLSQGAEEHESICFQPSQFTSNKSEPQLSRKLLNITEFPGLSYFGWLFEQFLAELTGSIISQNRFTERLFFFSKAAAEVKTGAEEQKVCSDSFNNYPSAVM